MSETIRAPDRGRNIAFLLYTDNEAHMNAKDLIEQRYAHVGILHNRDWYNEDTEDHLQGELKKEHFHILVSFKNPRYKSSLSKELGVEEHLIAVVSSFKDMSLYLTHKDIWDKAQYSIDDLFGSLKWKVIKFLNEDIEDNQVLDILGIIRDHHGPIKLDEFIASMCKHGYYSVCRRNWSVFYSIICDHNSHFDNES